MKKVYVMRGLPGSGKTTRALELAGLTGRVHSADDFFVENGKYKFDPTLLKENHKKNFHAFCESLQHGVPVVICDNTNSRHWEYREYIESALHHGYKVEIVSLSHPDPIVAAKRNTHGVPESAIRRMMERWEPSPTEDV